VLANRVERGDVCAALQQRVHRGTLILQGQLSGRNGHQRGSTARQQYDERFARIGAACNFQRAAACRHASFVRKWMARGNPLEVLWQLDGEMRTDDDAAPHAVARDRRKCVRHKGRGFPDGNHSQSLSLQARGNLGVLHGTIDQMAWRRGFNRTARDGQKLVSQ
jgi:hypothetical protein